MILQLKNPKQALNKAYLKEKVSRIEIELFKKSLDILYGNIERTSDEEHLKSQVAYFLRDTWYKEHHQINPIEKNDLAIHTGKSAKDPIGVIIEVKSITNRSEMISADKPNTKALHELILYYLRERIENNNNEIKYLIATNIEEWYIFDSNEFDKKIYRNPAIRKLYELKKTDRKDNPFFYEELQKNLEQATISLDASWFDITEYKENVRNKEIKDDKRLIALFKILSPSHLLKRPFLNDSNSLDTKFYAEFLHLVGLEEVKDANKKLITRKDKPDSASLLENTIIKIEDKDCLRHLPNPAIFGTTKKEQVFNIALELCITWINRLLFLKLLEAQLSKYHNGNQLYLFLNNGMIHDFDELSNLFFQVLAEKPRDRRDHLKDKFSRVPYLNSSLFERTELERKTFDISSLDNRLQLPLYEHSILKKSTTRSHTKKLPVLEYIFEFLDSYDFTSEGSEEIQEENKNLINASVLGLIFEKINGYKDGSFFTPGFVTMYMCKESIRRAVVDKFNHRYKIDCENLIDLKNFINTRFKPKDILEFNSVINDLKLCDPAVGSGHFLVSALNEIIAIKAELNILADHHGMLISGYDVKIENDELIITYNNNTEIFEYTVTENSVHDKTQHVQKTLFHEKEILIENCLFGVDVNENSVKICRLRLWIELLKSAYYTERSSFLELETLPNIDINIKCGNTLINRFHLDANLSKSLKSLKWNIDTYKDLVKSYKNATNKEEKIGFEKLINEIKKDFRTHIGRDNKEQKKLDKLISELSSKYYDKKLFDHNITPAQKKDKKKLEDRVNAQQSKIDSVRNSVIYEDAFEWRFEFPEVLNEEGDFIGFDIIIGNPPYGALLPENTKSYFKNNYVSTQGPFEVYKFFIEKGLRLLSKNAFLCYISPDTWTNLSYFKKLRNLIATDYSLLVCSETLYDVFEEATVDTNIYIITNARSEKKTFTIVSGKLEISGQGQITLSDDDSIISLKAKPHLIEMIEAEASSLDTFIEVWRGMSAYGAKNPEKPYNSNSKDSEFHRPMLNGGDIGKYLIKWSGEYIKYGKWLHRSRPSSIYDRPHLLVQRIRNPRLKDRLVAVYDDQKFISSDGLSNLLAKNEKNETRLLKSLLVLLNSKTINYWFSFYFFDVNIKPEQLRQIPVKKSILEARRLLTNIADYLLVLGRNSKDLIFFERLADAVIYELYLPEIIKPAGCEVIRYLTDLPDIKEDETQIKEIEKLHKSLSSPAHPVSSALHKLINVKEIAIIEKR